MSPPADSHGTSPASYQSKSGPTSSPGPETNPSSDIDADDTTLPMVLSLSAMCSSTSAAQHSAATPTGAEVVGDDVLSEPRDVGREDASTRPPGHGVDEASQPRVVAEHEDVELGARPAQLVDVRHRRAHRLLRRRPVEDGPPVDLDVRRR